MKIAIVHTLPLEYYPPVTNLLDILAQKKDMQVLVISTNNSKKRKTYGQQGIRLHRTAYPAYVKGLFRKLLAFAEMILSPLVWLIRFRPDVLMYYEPHSAYPVYLYKRYIRPSVRLFIHYHEYYTPEEFKAPHMKMVEFFHRKEVNFLYETAEWISQTNPFRLDFFSKDYPFIPRSSLHALPNYPPESWGAHQRPSSVDSPVKLLYLGALSFENTYIREMVEYVKKNPGKVILDIYSYQLADDVEVFLNNLHSENVRFFHEGVDYEKIPEIAAEYRAGLILYKPHNINYTFNAPNKLFEYLACGLDVWFPEEMTGTYPYITEGTYPKVIKTDFERLNELNLEEMISCEGLTYKPSEYFAEKVYGEFIDKYLLTEK